MHLSSIYALLIYCVHVSPTRIPMEFVSDHHSRGSFSTSSASSSTVDQDNKIIAKQTNLNADLIEQQKGKYREEIQTTRVLYQVGVSIKYTYIYIHIYGVQIFKKKTWSCSDAWITFSLSSFFKWFIIGIRVECCMLSCMLESLCIGKVCLYMRENNKIT